MSLETRLKRSYYRRSLKCGAKAKAGSAYDAIERTVPLASIANRDPEGQWTTVCLLVLL